MSETVNSYDLGDEVRCASDDPPFTNAAGTIIDPAAVFFKVKDPEGTVTIYQYGVDAQLVKVSTGIYRVDVDANKPGTWRYKFYSTGSGKAADVKTFTVEPDGF